MEPHKNTTEQDFRDKLNQREIMPSAAAWDRLDAMLAVAEEKKSKRGYGWLYIAASISGFLLIGTIFLSQTEEVIDQGRKPVVFDQQMRPAANPSEAIVPNTNSGAVASTENPTKIKTNNINHQSKSNQSIKTEDRATPSLKNVEISEQYPELVAYNQSNISTRGAAELLAAKREDQKTDNPASMKADELLAAVQSNNAGPKTSVKVNARNLLSEVDEQVNLTFREKMLRRASEVAGAVANRNIE